MTPLIEVAGNGGDPRALEELLKLGASIDARGPFGVTALLEAAGGGHLEAARVLLAHGASTTAADHDGWTALKLAEMDHKAGDAALLRGYGVRRGSPRPQHRGWCTATV